MVNVQELGLRGMITLRCDLAKLNDLDGMALPAMGRIVTDGDRALAWMSPDELLLMLPHAGVPIALANISQQCQELHHLAVDVSDARALFALSGNAAAREVMAKLAPVDLHPDGFGVGQFRRSRLGQVAAAFWMADNGDFNVICFRSVADYVAALLAQSANDGPVGHFN